jgi:hypothetical protein
MAGQEAFVDYRAVSPKPLRLEFRYNRKADLVIRSVTITRIDR